MSALPPKADMCSGHGDPVDCIDGVGMTELATASDSLSSLCWGGWMPPWGLWGAYKLLEMAAGENQCGF